MESRTRSRSQIRRSQRRTKVAAKESKPSTAATAEPVQADKAKQLQPHQQRGQITADDGEAIAAELAAAEAAKPTVELVNFAPEALKPGNAVRPGKRRPGSNLSGFRSMASELFKSK